MARNHGIFLVLLGMTAALAACAGGEGPRRPPGGFRGEGESRGGPGGPGAANVFLSPSGQPFRARRGEPYPVAAWFAAADADHDGRLTRAEFIGDAEAFFRQLDVNHDGQIDGFEMAAYEKATPELAPQVGQLRAGEGMNPNLGGGRGRGHGGAGRGGEASGPRGSGGGRQGGAGLYGLFDDPQPVAAADADLSGRVTLAEFRRLAETHFLALDKLGAGALTLAALPKTRLQQAAERQKEAQERAQQRPPTSPHRPRRPL